VVPQYCANGLASEAIVMTPVLGMHSFFWSTWGQDKGPSVVDLPVAATAEASDLTVLHVDADFDAIARVTSLPAVRADKP
jgi:hypothetical protein